MHRERIEAKDRLLNLGQSVWKGDRMAIRREKGHPEEAMKNAVDVWARI